MTRRSAAEAALSKKWQVRALAQHRAQRLVYLRVNAELACWFSETLTSKPHRNCPPPVLARGEHHLADSDHAFFANSFWNNRESLLSPSGAMGKSVAGAPADAKHCRGAKFGEG